MMSIRNKSIIEIFQALLKANKRIEQLESELNSYKENRMRKIYLATDSARVKCAFNTKKEAMQFCLQMAYSKREDYLKHFNEEDKQKEHYKVTELGQGDEGYRFMFSFYYVVSVDYVNR